MAPPQPDLPPGCTQADVDGPSLDEIESREAEEICAVEESERRAAAEMAADGRVRDDDEPADTDTDSVLNALRAPRALGRPNPDRWPQRREGMAEMLRAAADDLKLLADTDCNSPLERRVLTHRAADRYRGAIALFEAEEEGGDNEGDYDAGDGGD